MIEEELTRLRSLAVAALSPGGAFLRLDRQEALFVSDAPRRGLGDLSALKEEFHLTEANGLLRLTPRLAFVPPRLRAVFLRLMKALPAEREKLIRQTLAECLRARDAREIAFMTQLYKEEIP